jgi:hypothetical protein
MRLMSHWMTGRYYDTLMIADSVISPEHAVCHVIRIYKHGYRNEVSWFRDRQCIHATRS